MNEFFKSVVGKCFSYTLLCICFFAAMTLIGCFIAGNTDVLGWRYDGRVVISIISCAGTFGLIASKEI